MVMEVKHVLTRCIGMICTEQAQEIHQRPVKTGKKPAYLNHLSFAVAGFLGFGVKGCISNYVSTDGNIRLAWHIHPPSQLRQG